MLEIQQLAVNYRGVLGLDEISFSVEPGQVVGIIGPNGAGKSTMLKAMMGLVPITKGYVKYCTCPLCQQRERVAYLPQRSQIDWDYPVTVWNVVMMARTRYLGWFRSPGQSDRRFVKAALAQVEMDHLVDRRIGELSGGQQQRVFLARALAQQADLYLLDEPFTGVDQKTAAVMLQVFAELRSQNKIVLISSHNWAQALTQTDRLLLLNQRLIADGTPEQVMTAANLRQAYGVNLHGPNHSAGLDLNLFC
jgi:manganese/iron transport system ATP-binding protein